MMDNKVVLPIKRLDPTVELPSYAYDGDADRIGVVMENGEIMPIEHLMLLYIQDMFNNVQTKTFLYDIKCSKAIEDMVNLWGGKTICYRTGASYTEFKTHEDNLPFGGEYSGHLYFRDRDADCASAIYASLRLLEILSKTNEKLSKLVKNYPKYYTTPEVKIPSDDVTKFNVVEQIKEYAKLKNYPFNDIDGVRITYTNGWVLVRASNTGPNITFRAEATSEEGIISLKSIYLPMIEKYNKPVDTLQNQNKNILFLFCLWYNNVMRFLTWVKNLITFQTF